MLLFSSPFLDAGKREALADYALVVAVLVMSFVASYFMRDIQSKYGIDLDETVLMKLNTTLENSSKKICTLIGLKIRTKKTLADRSFSCAAPDFGICFLPQ